jgi:hypothetical protein
MILGSQRLCTVGVGIGGEGLVLQAEPTPLSSGLLRSSAAATTTVTAAAAAVAAATTVAANAVAAAAVAARPAAAITAAAIPAATDIIAAGPWPRRAEAIRRRRELGRHCCVDGCHVGFWHQLAPNAGLRSCLPVDWAEAGESVLGMRSAGASS